MMSQLIDHIKEASKHILDLSHDSHKTEAYRKEALDKFVAKGFPTTKQEQWKYTNLRPILSDNYKIYAGAASNTKVDYENYLLDKKHGYIALLNGSVIASKIPEGVEIVSENDQNKFTRTTEDILSKGSEIEWLNIALHTDTLTLNVAERTEVGTPVEILYFYDETASFYSTRISIEVAESSSISVIERHISLAPNSMMINHLSDSFVHSNAKLNYSKMQNYPAHIKMIDYTQVDIQRDATGSVFTSSLGGELVRNNLHMNLYGENGTANMGGISFVLDSETIDHHTSIRHEVPHCQSNELYKGVYGGKSRGVFNGKVYVKKDAQKTNGFQQNNNVLLSNTAKVYAKPELEIFADDVRCSHGCTIGQLNEEGLHYLKTRGISHDKAMSMLTLAFVQEALEYAPDEVVRKVVTQQLEAIQI